MTLALSKKFFGMAVALLVLPVLASCGQQVAETPSEAPVSQTSPGVTTEPNATEPDTSTSTGDVVSVVQNEPSLSTLASAIAETGLNEELSAGGPYTIFAPTDEAFAALPEDARQELLLPENRELLREVLTYHVVPGQLTADQLASSEIQSLEGTPLTVTVDQASNEVQVNNASVTQPDILASNGVIHVVDQIILPPNVSMR